MEMNHHKLKTEYESKYSNYWKLSEIVESILQNEIKSEKVNIHSISKRIKSWDSLLVKIHRKKIENPFDEIHDIVGLRIVCLFLEDLDMIEKIIKKTFFIFETDDKIDGSQPELFGYMSLHMKAKLDKNQIRLPQNSESLFDIPFEIQVRTVAQDAWASISHYLEYKNETNIPNPFKRDFYALSGLFYVADTHFSMIRKDQSKIILE